MKNIFQPLTIIAGIMIAVLPGYCQVGYTDPAAFDAALTDLIGNTAVDFDSQPDGSEAVIYGTLSVSARGLASDGDTTISMPTIATAAFPSQSAPNSLGVSGKNQQFLAGNTDVITFDFSEPVHAFGLYLIGNPSPTGDPPIPFWRLGTGKGGFNAYSATDPLATLGPGNDVYFLGIISPTPFRIAVLLSNNDPAAVFSFNVDSLVWANLPPLVALGDVKSMPSGSFTVSDAVVTRVHPDRFNIETPDRQFGMAVLGGGATRGKLITLVGSVTATPDDECAIDLGAILEQTDSTPPRPMGMVTRSLGGSADFGLQIGLPESQGPNNIGLDARMWGTVTALYVGPSSEQSWIKVDDGVGLGSGLKTPGVKVVGLVNAGEIRIGQHVQVNGSISLWKAADDTHYPLIRVAAPEDIVSY